MPQAQIQSSPQEDISVVLGRFHAWDADRKKTVSGSQAEVVRELSYEEALAYSHPRRSARNAHVSPAPSSTPVQNYAPAEPDGRAVRTTPAPASTGADPETKRGGAQSAAASKGSTAQRNAAKRLSSAARKPHPARETKAAESVLGEASTVPRKSAPGRKPATKAALPARVSEPRNVHPNQKRKATAVKAAPRGSVAPDASNRGAATKPERKPVSSTAHAGARPSATFHGALAACMKEVPRRPLLKKLAPAGKSVKPVVQQASTAVSRRTAQKSVKTKAGKNAAAPTAQEVIPRKTVESIARTISVNLRLSKSEHDRMRRGATEADLTLATFIRESTLRYQIAREREKQQAKEFGNGDTGRDLLEDVDYDSFDPPVLAPSGPSLLTRMKNFWLGRRLTAIA